MAKSADVRKLTGIEKRFGAFVAERHPLVLGEAIEAFKAVTRGGVPSDEHGLEALRPAFRQEFGRRLHRKAIPPDLPDPTPRTSIETRLTQAYDEVLDGCDGFFSRAAIEASLTPDERREILRGMMLTRA